jgi:hypothetical protein
MSGRRRRRSAHTPKSRVNARNGRNSANRNTPSCAVLISRVSTAANGSAISVT